MQEYQMPNLSYDFGDLEPVISGEIMELHYSKHHATYLKNLQIALEKYAVAEGKKDIAEMIALQQAIKFNGGGHINHSIFWSNLTPQRSAGEPSGDLLIEINKSFGSLESLIEKMSARALAIQGSGWGWLGYCKVAGKLIIETCPNQDPLSVKGLIPLLGIDVWEHAYYLQYKNVRQEYIKNIWKIVNWKNVEERFLVAKG